MVVELELILPLLILTTELLLLGFEFINTAESFDVDDVVNDVKASKVLFPKANDIIL